MIRRLFAVILSAAWLVSSPVLAQTKISASQTVGSAGVYQVTVTGLTVTLPNWTGWSGPVNPIVIQDGTGSTAPNITVQAPLGGTIDGLSSVTINNSLQSLTLYPFQGGNTWVGGGTFTPGQSSVVSSDIPVGSPVAQTVSGTAINITSVSLTAGDWDCLGSVVTNPAGSTTTSQLAGGISTVSATLPAAVENGETIFQAPQAAGVAAAIPMRVEEVLSAPTTVFLVGDSVFGVSTMSLYGQLVCRRMR
jgi:hypothetical protein